MRLALIGKKLSHSFSRDIHMKMGLDYDLCELEEGVLKDFFLNSAYSGFNVTIPYKQNAYNLVDELDQTALKAGVVNTVLRKEGKTIGFNTDVFGVKYMLSTKGVSVKDKCVLILGSGGACSAVKALCSIDGAKQVYVCSRTGDINYSNVYEKAKNAQILINCTPVGMSPNVNERLVDLSKFNNLILVADCIYNPLKTALLLDAEKLEIPYVNGLSMLVAQALKSEEIWLNKKIDNSNIDNLYLGLLKQKLNIVLVGMPGCGKTSIGKELAQILAKEFIDVDEVIKEKFASPKEIIEQRGEQAFRDIESLVVKKVGCLNGKVIATGGGSILREENISNLKQNSIVIYIDRDISSLDKEGRPLSNSQGLEKIFEIRHPIYKRISEKVIDNNKDVKDAIKEIVSYYENISY